MFQIDGYKTRNQGGQTMNLYFRYRYRTGLSDAQTPDYEDLRRDALTFMGHVDTTKNPYWETLNHQLCSQLASSFPLEAITCQLQILPDSRPGLAYEPGYHSSIDTIGDIEPLALPGPVTNDKR